MSSAANHRDRSHRSYKMHKSAAWAAQSYRVKKTMPKRKTIGERIKNGLKALRRRVFGNEDG